MFVNEFKVIEEIAVRWGDLDAFNHVNNTLFFRYFECARIKYFIKASISSTSKDSSIGPILAKTNCTFIHPIFFPDNLLIGAKVSSLQEDRFVMDYGIYSLTQNHLVAKGQGTIVSYDYQNKKKASIPQTWIEAIRKIEETK